MDRKLTLDQIKTMSCDSLEVYIHRYMSLHSQRIDKRYLDQLVTVYNQLKTL